MKKEITLLVCIFPDRHLSTKQFIHVWISVCGYRYPHSYTDIRSYLHLYAVVRIHKEIFTHVWIFVSILSYKNISVFVSISVTFSNPYPNLYPYLPGCEFYISKFSLFVDANADAGVRGLSTSDCTPSSSP